MKRYLTLYDNTKTYVTPDMNQAPPSMVAEKYSVVNIGVSCVIETDESGIMLYTAPAPISVMRSNYSIEQTLTDEEAIRAIEEILNAPEPDQEPSANDRIAAALEYQNLLSM